MLIRLLYVFYFLHRICFRVIYYWKQFEPYTTNRKKNKLDKLAYRLTIDQFFFDFLTPSSHKIANQHTLAFTYE